MTNASFFTKSYTQFANGPWLSRAAMQWFFNACAPKLTDRVSSYDALAETEPAMSAVALAGATLRGVLAR